MVRLTLRMPDKLNKELKEKAKEQNISKNALIIRACTELIKSYKKGVDE